MLFNLYTIVLEFLTVFYIFYIFYISSKELFKWIYDFIYNLFLKGENKKDNKIDKKVNNKNILPYSEEIDKLIINDLYDNLYNKTANNKLLEMSLHSTAGGKRVRSVIIKALCPDKSINDLKHSILFIEYLHASSLIIDDIMDNDTYRRDELCCHVKYGTSNAQMCSIYLLSLAQIHLGKLTKSLKKSNIDAVLDEIFRNFSDLCLGQYFDIDNNVYSVDDLIAKKTGSLFVITYLLALMEKRKEYINKEEEIYKEDIYKEEINKEDIDINKKEEEIFKKEEEIFKKYKKLGEIMGKYFQIADDFEDYEKDKKFKSGLNNYIYNNDFDKSLNEIETLIKDYKDLSTELSINSDIIDKIITLLHKKCKKAYKEFSNNNNISNNLCSNSSSHILYVLGFI